MSNTYALWRHSPGNRRQSGETPGWREKISGVHGVAGRAGTRLRRKADGTNLALHEFHAIDELAHVELAEE